MYMTETETFHLQPWTPRVAVVAGNVIDEIHSLAPELEVLFMGAAALGLPGKNDIDLDILCNIADVPLYAERLAKVLGVPKENNGKVVAWKFVKEGFEVDCILSDPAISHVPKRAKMFELLKTNPELLEEYNRLKTRCDGLSYKEYENHKIDFFERHYVAAEPLALFTPPPKLSKA